jgi:hypothetical protein
VPEGVLQAVNAQLDAFGRMPPSAAPFGLGISKAILEAAIRKLPILAHRVSYGRPVRGMDQNDVEALAAHADALVPAFGPDDPEFAIGVAYLNAFTYAHHLVLGEAHSRNHPEPVFALAEAAEAQGLSRSEDTDRCFVPLTLVRGAGVIYGVGALPSSDLTQRWTPREWMYVPFGRARSLRLDQLDDLRTFFEIHPLDLGPTTLAGVIHLLLASFPFGARIQLLEPDLLDRFVQLEAGSEQAPRAAQLPSALLGVDRTPHAPQLAEIAIRVEPPGVEVRYRRGTIEVSD